ncbi:putative RNase H-like HicB family nuclease [Herbihabitans rhizosphaerae]|uniref:Putative RNase H-like HicB family nuclease n=1 Tax=Herbihabitans rhizosphaerae TaxID=1872711 RepID=A0A4Q7KBA3_9PSEU|nr:putative RNase H-like HicB family nuclease [Herbihabitans rhizosphaerae]
MPGYAILVYGDEAGGFSSYSPSLPGVVAAASTYDECATLMREAVAFHLEGLREAGDPVPEPDVVGAEVVVVAA